MATGLKSRLELPWSAKMEQEVLEWILDSGRMHWPVWSGSRTCSFRLCWAPAAWAVETTCLWPLEGGVPPGKLKPECCGITSLDWSLGGRDDDTDHFLLLLVTPGSRVAKITCNYKCILINDLRCLLGILGIIFPAISWSSTQLDILLCVFYYCKWVVLTSGASAWSSSGSWR